MNNPFEYDAAPNLDPQQLIEWYIGDHNYSRFMASRRNVIINGERGSGKSMTLIYHSLRYTVQRGAFEGDSPASSVLGVYVPCNTPLSSKEEHRLLDEVARMRVSEANLTLSVVANIAREFASTNTQLTEEDRDLLLEEFAFALNLEPPGQPIEPFAYLTKEVRRKVRRIQTGLHQGIWDAGDSADSFSLLVLPILEAIRRTEHYRDSHISLLIDDGQDLNAYQQRLVNAWVGYRENSVFSVKLAIAGVRAYNFETVHGGALLEGHDYVTVDLQRPVQNNQSEFGRFVRSVVARRLMQSGISARPEEFFPVSKAFVSGLDKAKADTEKLATERGLSPGSKQFNDFVYKQKRALYFRERSAKANKPQYSGFETLTHLSTGVIRNLLQPCYFMYEQQSATLHGKQPSVIFPETQDTVIKEQSDRLWEMIENNLERRLSNCTQDEARAVARMFHKLAEYFRDRLLNHASEPRVVTFIISEREHPDFPNLNKLLLLAERAQILYVRPGTSKKGGGREPYYVPNRMLWPRYGLDADGQHGRASIRAKDLWDAAMKNTPIPFAQGESEPESPEQGGLFDGE